MEALITEPGAKNPLLFLSLSLVNRIPGYNPDEKETLNQLECMNDLISSVSSSLFRLETVLGASAVAIDALMTISAIESKKSVSVRVSALECLLLLLTKISACGIHCLIDVMPGILSKMVKFCTSRVDVEVEKVIILSLRIIETIVKCFWDGQEDWKSIPNDEENFVLLRQKYRTNIEMVLCALRPLIKCRERIDTFREIILNIFSIHLKAYRDQVNLLFLKLYFLLSRTPEPSLLTTKKILQLYNTEVVEWFEINSDTLMSIHEEILIEKLELICAVVNLKNSESFLLISDLFAIVKRFTELKKININAGEIVSIEYSPSFAFGIQNAFVKEESGDKLTVPEINFKRSLKLSKDFFNLVDVLFSKLIEKDPEVIQSLILKLDSNGDSFDSEVEVLIQKIDMAAFYYSKIRHDCVSNELLRDCLKYYERSIAEGKENHELIHLITLKLLWTSFHRKDFDFRPNLLIILSGMASDWILLKEASTQILKGISRYFDETIRQFIGKHEIFILDRLGIQLSLPSLYPKAPQIISCLIREILDSKMSLKFTDLLVKKVSDNLALYQNHSNYCKDLIEVVYETVEIVSRNEQSIKFIDPKDFAFTKEDSDEENEKPLKPSINCQQMIIIDLLKIGINFILSDSKLIRSKSINLIEVSVSNYLKYHQQETRDEPSNLCQIIHLAWPNMISVLKDSAIKNESSTGQLDAIVVEYFASCCKVLFEMLPIFMRDRFVKDYWRLFLSHMDLKRKFNSLNSSVLKITNLLIEILNYGLTYCKPSTEICLEVLEFLKSIIKSVVGNGVSFIVSTFQIIAKLEPDVIWYFYFIELGELKEISSPSSELNSFVLSCKGICQCDPIVKEKLKQFIQ